MALKFVDASDYSGRNVNENLYNIRLNSDRLSNITDIIFSIHFNGFNEKAEGTEMWSYLGDNVSKPVAVALSKAVAEAQGIPNRGQKSTTDLYVVANTKAHMILMEICFLDNKREIENYIKNEQKVIDAIINVCKQFPHLTFSATSAGHGGLKMMDPGVSRHGYKENELAHRINKAIINYKLQSTKPTTPKPNPITQGIPKAKGGLWYRSHLSNVGWLGFVGTEETSGTTGKAIPIEAIDVRWDNQTDKISASFQDIKGKWHEWEYGDTGTTGKALALSVVRFDLGLDVRNTGRILQYRVHSADIGWSDWKNQGEVAGTSGKQIEAIQMRMLKDEKVEKG